MTQPDRPQPRPLDWEAMARNNGAEWIRESRRLVRFRDLLLKEMPSEFATILKLYEEALRAY